MSTKVRAIVWVALTVAALVIAGVTPPAMAAEGPAPPREGTGAQITSFFFGKGNQITPVPPFNESRGTSVDAPGVSFPRFLLTNVGTWSITLSEGPLAIDSLDGLAIWASSDQGAKNVRFTINVATNGNSVGSLNTETKAALGASPEEFRIDAGNSRVTAAEFPQGSQLSFQLQYRASSNLPAGPSAASTFHYYGDLYRSRIDFVTNPFNLTLADLRVEENTGHLNITEIVKDAFSVDPAQKLYFVTFAGPTSSLDRFVRQVDVRLDPLNGTTLVWNWDFGAQGGVTSGAYAVTLSAAYLGSTSNYTNVSSAQIDFPQFTAGAGGLALPVPLLLGAAIAAGGAAVAVKVVRAKSAAGRRP